MRVGGQLAAMLIVALKMTLERTKIEHQASIVSERKEDELSIAPPQQARNVWIEDAVVFI